MDPIPSEETKGPVEIPLSQEQAVRNVLGWLFSEDVYENYTDHANELIQVAKENGNDQEAREGVELLHVLDLLKSQSENVLRSPNVEISIAKKKLNEEDEQRVTNGEDVGVVATCTSSFGTLFINTWGGVRSASDRDLRDGMSAGVSHTTRTNMILDGRITIDINFRDNNGRTQSAFLTFDQNGRPGNQKLVFRPTNIDGVRTPRDHIVASCSLSPKHVPEFLRDVTHLYKIRDLNESRLDTNSTPIKTIGTD